MIAVTPNNSPFGIFLGSGAAAYKKLIRKNKENLREKLLKLN